MISIEPIQEISGVTVSRKESYGQIVVFKDIAGNRWDLLGPA
ncbi:hypothetical protein Psi01_80980 [Planobispora siamensis]|uniref:Uncharacterized protein n=1 Tax=Planobispora siamensis TaxID=936338 RepID=A0A8J3SXR8_9ACTN|nr:hypothetical protein Psi01_80980 [Planobispora siamensis]